LWVITRILLAGAYELLFNIGVKALLLALVYAYFHQVVSLPGLLFAPMGILAISLAGFSIGLALTPIGMLYKDISRGLAVVLPFFMYLTPVVYPVPRQGTIALIMKWNPLASLIIQTRNWFTAQPMYDMHLFWIYTSAFALLFLVALVAYRISMPIIIERIGS
jgi:lipopolysaccharide transport system permease protein